MIFSFFNGDVDRCLPLLAEVSVHQTCGRAIHESLGTAEAEQAIGKASLYQLFAATWTFARS